MSSLSPDQQPAAPPRAPLTAVDSAANPPPAQKRVYATPKTPRNSIDAVLDTAPAKTAAPVASPPLSKRPSWIGPRRIERAITPGGTAMKFPVLVEFESPGLQPPVFICSSLTEPQWNPIEMESSTKDNGEHHFRAAFQVEEGEYQYKLRLGPGDWWVCDNTKPLVDDGAGNQNNLLVVKADFKAASVTAPVLPQPSPLSNASVPDATPANNTPANQVQRDSIPHLANAPAADSHATHHDEAPHAPLMPHEVAPSTESHAPLFRHESINAAGTSSEPMSPTSSSPAASRKPSLPVVAPEADPKDPSLVKFPSDREGIIKHIQGTQTYLPADVPAIEVSPPGSSAASVTASPQVLPSVREDALPEASDVQDPRYEPEDGTTLPDDDSARPAAPITPPLTPKERESAAEQEAVAELLTAEVVELAVAEAVLEAEAQALAKQRRKEARKANFGAFTLALGFAAAVGALALGVWLSNRAEGYVV